MRLYEAQVLGPVGVKSRVHFPHNHVVLSNSQANPKLSLSVRKDPLHDPQGLIVRMLLATAIDDTDSIIVGKEGFLQYLKQYVAHLMEGFYKPLPVLGPILGIDLFPDAGNDFMSVCVTQGIEVRASARWIPYFNPVFGNMRGLLEEKRGLDFSYHIRVRMIDSSVASTYQLVSFHLEGVDGRGEVSFTIDDEFGEDQEPLLALRQDPIVGQVFQYTLPNGEVHTNTPFSFNSETGPMAGTTRENDHGAHIRGYFRCVPGSRENPEGPPFEVVVARFPLKVPDPYY